MTKAKKQIRTSRHSLKYATSSKDGSLDLLFDEYTRVVNAYVKLIWDMKGLRVKFVNKEFLDQVETWLSMRLKQQAGNFAKTMVNNAFDQNRSIIYAKYKKIYAKAKDRHSKWNIIKERWSVWRKGKEFRCRVSMPVFGGTSIELSQRFVKIEKGKNSFDLWLMIYCIGNKMKLFLPTKKHEHMLKFKKDGYKLGKSCRLEKINGNYYVSLFHEKPIRRVKNNKREIGIDIGLNKLMATSEGDKIGTEMKSKLDKLNNRVPNSHNWKQTQKEIKDYIGWCVNQLDFTDLSTIVIEDLSVQSLKMKFGNKKHKQRLQYWNVDLLRRRLWNRCVRNRVTLALVPPFDTSITCPKCGAIHAESRDKEDFACIACGYKADADCNAGVNILSKFQSSGKPIVSHGQKRVS